MSETTKRGIIFSLVAALISGVSIFYNKLIIIKGVEPIVLNIFKNGGVALIFSLIVLTAKRNLLYKLSKTDWFKLITLGIIGGGIPFVLFFEGLKYAPILIRGPKTWPIPWGFAPHFHQPYRSCKKAPPPSS